MRNVKSMSHLVKYISSSQHVKVQVSKDATWFSPVNKNSISNYISNIEFLYLTTGYQEIVIRYDYQYYCNIDL